MRIIHDHARYPYRMLGRWLSLIVREKLQSHVYIASGDREFLEKIRDFAVGPEDRFVTLHVKHLL